MPSDPLWQVLLGTVLLSTMAFNAVFASPLPGPCHAFGLPLAIGGAVVYQVSASGDAKWFALTLLWSGLFFGGLGQLSGITHSEAAIMTERFRRQSRTDFLTGLANRSAFMEKLDAVMSVADGTDQDVVVVMLDLDGFKPVNDSMGHTAGDQTLAIVAARLDGAVRTDELVARVGGDEFAVVATTTSGAGEQLAQDLGARLLSCFDKQLRVDGIEIAIGCSVGTCVSQPGGSGEALITRADSALYEAKRAGGGRAQHKAQAVPPQRPALA